MRTGGLLEGWVGLIETQEHLRNLITHDNDSDDDNNDLDNVDDDDNDNDHDHNNVDDDNGDDGTLVTSNDADRILTVIVVTERTLVLRYTGVLQYYSTYMVFCLRNTGPTASE